MISVFINQVNSVALHSFIKNFITSFICMYAHVPGDWINYTAQAGPGLTLILLFQSPQRWGCKHVPPCLVAYISLLDSPRTTEVGIGTTLNRRVLSRLREARELAQDHTVRNGQTGSRG